MGFEQLKFESAKKLLHSRFRVQVDASKSVELELIEVTQLKHTPGTETKRGTYEGFSLIFEGPAGQLLPQRIYTLKNPDFGGSELFIVPIGQDAKAIRYEAVFNRFVPGSDGSAQDQS